ncbi:MAG: hypothetical protein OXD45_09670 [Rhodobacteraceae bacterium]|nr:hypothetical protein [Paracoccaceae bacterium]
MFLLTSCKSSLFAVLDQTARSAGPKPLRQTIQYRPMTLRLPFSQAKDVTALLEALAARYATIREQGHQLQESRQTMARQGEVIFGPERREQQQAPPPRVMAWGSPQHRSATMGRNESRVARRAARERHCAVPTGSTMS